MSIVAANANSPFSILAKISSVERFASLPAIASGMLPIENRSNHGKVRRGKQEEFYTAPASPEMMDDQEEEEFMVMSETGPDVFLTGNYPTKLDKDVLDAIENCDIPPFKYPYIVLWKLACDQKSKDEPSERWPTPKPPHRLR
ncbi:ankyrin repeat and LEM domain-containing protein 2-like [Halyomorpha halys]|uniref:ankyrin repeat and LEM domain-containing protein 2-like n=1 Tax=Halyomorpha halys TaxID=286706 RepID=UPI0034D25A4E